MLLDNYEGGARKSVCLYDSDFSDLMYAQRVFRYVPGTCVAASTDAELVKKLCLTSKFDWLVLDVNAEIGFDTAFMAAVENKLTSGRASIVFTEPLLKGSRRGADLRIKGFTVIAKPLTAFDLQTLVA